MTAATAIRKRRINFVDALVLTAFTAVGLFWCLFYFRDQTLRDFFWNRVCHVPMFMLAAWTVAFAPLRLRQPRPCVRRLCRRLGTASCVYVIVLLVVWYAMRAALWLAWFSIPDGQLAAEGVERPLTSDPSGELFIMPIIQTQVYAGAGVIATWTLLALTGARRPNDDWVEAFGTALGVGWILLLFADAASTALSRF